MDKIVLLEVNNSKLLNEFALLPFELYKDDSSWVPPIISEYKKYVSGADNSLCDVGPHVKLIARIDGKTVGRILYGIDEKLNEYKKMKVGYISQFECIEDYAVAEKIMRQKNGFYKRVWIELKALFLFREEKITADL